MLIELTQKEFEELLDVLKSAGQALHYSKHPDFGKPDLLINRITDLLQVLEKK